MSYTALSLSQSPPLSVPIRYFLTAPLFLAVTGMVLLLFPETLVNRWTTATLAATHLFTLGFLAMTMVGALQQLLPVLAGSTLPHPEWFSRTIHFSLTVGVVLLTAGMGRSHTLLLQSGTAIVLLTLLLYLLAVSRALWRAQSAHATVWAMAASLLALLITVGLSAGLLNHYHWQVPFIHPLTDLHLVWGLFGWVGLLLIGVAYQVVPMFQLTPDYPRQLRRWLVPVLVAGLLLWSGVRLTGGGNVWLLPVVVLSLLFASVTLWLQQRRRRRLPDVTLDFWRISMAALIASLLLIMFPGEHALMTGVLLLAGFALSAVSGMLYKIVPFLIWLHLNNQLQQRGNWLGKVPNMKQVIAEVAARRHYRLHLLTLVVLLLATLWPQFFTRLAGVSVVLSALLLEWNLLQGVMLYRRILNEAVEGE